ncbi:phage head closure protein [Thalassovita sp.]|uniref:phage head closure protein n=1 Tax=Thalassovita sp. TaxID=1979401 RepID=UPI003B5BFE94
MRAEKFNTRVTFEEKVKVPNGGGGHAVDWREMLGADLGKRWAAVWPVAQHKSDEEATASHVSNAPDYKLTVRTDRGTRTVKSDWRVMIDGQPFAIKSVARPDRARGTITMIIQEGQPT